MSLFHRHIWKDLGDYEHHPSRSYNYRGSWLSDPEGEDRMKKYDNGWTTFHQRCGECGKVATRSVIGRFGPSPALPREPSRER